MIVFDHVTKHYKTNIGLDDVSIRIDRGEFVFLVGPSGAGKTTFVRLMLKEIDADKGNRTPTMLPSADFESAASASSAISADKTSSDNL